MPLIFVDTKFLKMFTNEFFFFKLDKLHKKTYTNIIVKFITMLNLS